MEVTSSAYFWLDAGSTHNQNKHGNQAGTFEFAQVQVEKGSSASILKRKQKLPRISCFSTTKYKDRGEAMLQAWAN